MKDIKEVVVLTKEQKGDDNIHKFWKQFYTWCDFDDYQLECIMYKTKDNIMFWFMEYQKVYFGDDYSEENDEYYNDFYEENRMIEFPIFGNKVINLSNCLDIDYVKEMLSALAKHLGIKFNYIFNSDEVLTIE